jgi:hypothetical protein
VKPTAVTIAALALAALAFCAPVGASPGDVLYDQYDHAGTIGAGSQNFEAALDPYDDAAADDFEVPAGPGWNVTGVEVQGAYFNGPGPATSVNVAVYSNAGDLPGTLLASRPNQSFTGDPSFVVTLDPSIGLFEGRYWISVQANQTFSSAGQWAWLDRTEQATSAAAWQNPGGGQGRLLESGLPDVHRRRSAPDQVFRLTELWRAPAATARHRRHLRRHLLRHPPLRLRHHRLRLRHLHRHLHHRSAAASQGCSDWASEPRSEDPAGALLSREVRRVRARRSRWGRVFKQAPRPGTVKRRASP